MKKSLSFLLLALLLIPSVCFAQGRVHKSNLANLCKRIIPPPGNVIYKSVSSAGFSDNRSGKPTFLGAGGATQVAGNCLSILDGNGKTIDHLGRYPSDGWVYRFYGGFGCGGELTPAQVGAIAKKNTGSYNVYLKINNTLCITVDPRKCYHAAHC